jgi:hypothetical protein
MTRWLLVCAVAAVASAALLPPPAASGEPGVRDERRSPEQIAGTLVDRAAGFVAERAYAEAITALRGALAAAPTHRGAAAELTRLHEDVGVDLVADVEAVTRVHGHLEAMFGAEFRRVETRHFVILTDAAPSWARERERLLERTYDMVLRFARRANLPARPPEHKLLVLLFAEHADYRAFAARHDGVEAAWVAGYYATLPNHAVFYDDATGPLAASAHASMEERARAARDARERAGELSRGSEYEREAAEQLRDQASALAEAVEDERRRISAELGLTADAKAVHEAAHLVAFNAGIQLRSRHYPFWVTEGLATNFETHDPTRTFGPDAPTEEREEQFDAIVGADGLIPLREFVGLVHPPAGDERTIRRMYAQAYALFRDVFRYDREKLAALLDDIARERASALTEARLVELFERHFGDAEAYERRWRGRMR